MWKVMDDWDGGVGGIRITNADDIVTLTTNEDDINIIMMWLADESHLYSLEINRSKTKVMIINRRSKSSTCNVAGFAVVDRFEYLGSVVLW